MPVSNISKFEIDAFAKWINLRVPHEFEWEISSNLLNDKFKVWEWSENEFFGYKFLSLTHIKNILILGLTIVTIH